MSATETKQNVRFPRTVLNGQNWQPAPQQPAAIRPRPLGDYLATGWQRYGVARGAFVSTSGYYAYEQRRNVCALAAIYIGATGASFDEVRYISFDACQYGILRVTGVNLAYVYAPAVASSEYVQRGRPVSLLAHLAHLTDVGWPKAEIIDYCYRAQDWHNKNNRR